jgi:cystathionine beta-lyase
VSTSEHTTPEDIVAHLGDDYDRYLGAISPPIFQTTLFTRKRESHGYHYTRASNPTIEVAEKKIAAMEGGEMALCFSSGMAAITATMLHHLEAGAHVVAPASIYPPARAFLARYMERFKVEPTFVTGLDLAEIEAAIRPNTRLIYLESPASSVFELQDLRAIAELARHRGIPTAVDNSWATPLFQHPLELGIDIVVHSGSKYLGGHSDIIAGVVVGSAQTMTSMQHIERGLLGATMDPHQAWLLTRSLRTLPLRMERHQANAMRIARFLEAHPRVERVLYPGLQSHPQYELFQNQMSGSSGLLSLVPAAQPEGIHRFIDRLQMFELGPSWGGHESLVHPMALDDDQAEARARRIPPNLVRLSIGLESVETLEADLDQALNGM